LQMPSEAGYSICQMVGWVGYLGNAGQGEF
jgi:hypothetical protein